MLYVTAFVKFTQPDQDCFVALSIFFVCIFFPFVLSVVFLYGCYTPIKHFIIVQAMMSRIKYMKVPK